MIKVGIFTAGAVTGYVLGARAGRERYEQIVSLTKRIAGDPRVQHGAKVAGTQAVSAAGTVGAAAGHAAADVGSKVVDKAKDVVSKGDDEVEVEVDVKVGPITANNSTGTAAKPRSARTGS